MRLSRDCLLRLSGLTASVWLLALLWYDATSMQGSSSSSHKKRHSFAHSNKVTWGHAVNSMALLDEAIASRLMMLEADIMAKDDQPVMAHPPVIPENAPTFQEWLRKVLAHFKVLKETWTTPEAHEKELDAQERVFGIKLDFKDPRAVEPCLVHLRKVLDEEETEEDQHHLQVWLNADVLAGPGGEPPVFRANTFIAACMKEFPFAVLSLGWTTSAKGVVYTQEMVDEMIAECKQGGVPGDQLTFAVMAGWMRPSWPNMLRLLTELPRSSLTLWGWCDETLLPWLENTYTDYGRNIFVDCKVRTREELLAMLEKYKKQSNV